MIVKADCVGDCKNKSCQKYLPGTLKAMRNGGLKISSQELVDDWRIGNKVWKAKEACNNIWLVGD